MTLLDDHQAITVVRPRGVLWRITTMTTTTTTLLLLLLLLLAAATDKCDAGQITQQWTCPQLVLASGTGITCQCDMPHTLRCAGQARSAADVASIVSALRALPRERSVSLLDLSVQNVSRLGDDLFERATPLHGLVVSSGEISGDVSARTFVGLAATLTALGLPNNRLTAIPSQALRSLIHLERLDLSNNRIRTITGRPFAGLDGLRFLDLSGNAIETIAPASLAPSLRILQLRSNLLEVSQLSSTVESSSNALSGLVKLQELDLSFNRLRGRLTSSFLQGLDGLLTLHLTGNNFTLLKRGMLSGLKRLRTLRLARNQIDVIEDQSFVALTSLTTLDLSHNGVVAISGQSLSNLDNLLQLDLSHNYLRAVTIDLVGSLTNLQSLDLTDNDISLVQPAVMAALPKLIHFSLADNPLNCDCHLVELARWLRNSNSSEHDANGRSVVCATPPSLENGLLVETAEESLTCQEQQTSLAQQHDDDKEETDEDSQDGSNFLSSQPNEDFIRLSSAQVQFVSAQLEGSALLHTRWTVDAATLPYTCDAILVYELNEEHEALLDSYPVRCHSEEQHELGHGQQHQLNLTVKLSDSMKTDGQYRLCLVLFEGGHDDEASLLPGCSHSMTWQTLKSRQHGEQDIVESSESSSDYSDATASITATTSTTTTTDDGNQSTQITAFYANVSTATSTASTVGQSVSVYMRIPDAPPRCQFTVVVFENQRLLARQKLNCSTTSFTFSDLLQHEDKQQRRQGDEPASGEYQVCATFDQQGHFLPPPDSSEREADGDIILPAVSVGATKSNATVVTYEHCVVAKVPGRAWAVENTLVVIAVTVVFVLIAAAILLFSYLLARRVFFRRTKLWGSSSDPLAGGFISSSVSSSSSSNGLPKTASRHILYVPENDFFSSDSSGSGASSPDGREAETCTNV